MNGCKIAGCVANSVDPDQTPRSAASDLGLHCLPRPVFANTKGKYGHFESNPLKNRSGSTPAEFHHDSPSNQSSCIYMNPLNRVKSISKQPRLQTDAGDSSPVFVVLLWPG